MKSCHMLTHSPAHTPPSHKERELVANELMSKFPLDIAEQHKVLELVI